jgi:restriction system protein
MSRNWRKRKRYNSGRPEDLVFLLLVTLVLSIIYPPIRQVVISFWYIYAFAILGIGIIVAIKIYHQYQLSKAGIYEVDKMSGTDFEMFLVSLFSKLGYKAQHTGKTGDLGSDLVIEMGGVKIAVQAKRYTGNVGPDAVREVNTVMRPRNCTLGMVVTNRYYTNEAKYLAKQNNIALWDRNDLVSNILKSQKAGEVTSLEEIPLCPKCNSAMITRSGKYGHFWGCSRFPSCKGTRNI